MGVVVGIQKNARAEKLLSLLWYGVVVVPCHTREWYHLPTTSSNTKPNLPHHQSLNGESGGSLPMSCPVSTKTTTCPPPVPTESPRIQQRTVWKRLHEYHSARTSSFSSDSVKSERLWPTYDQVAAHIAEADYNHTLTCPMDLLPLNNMNDQGKIICPHAAMCCISMELFPCPEGEKPYTGLLTPAKNIEHGIIRLSSAMKPPGEMKSYFARTLLRASGEKLRKSRLFPCAALKFFREGSSSGNLLFGGSKIGQRESNYFAHCMCTSMTEQMPALVVSAGSYK